MRLSRRFTLRPVGAGWEMTSEFGDAPARRFDGRQAAEAYYGDTLRRADTWLIVLPAHDPADAALKRAVVAFVDDNHGGRRERCVPR